MTEEYKYESKVTDIVNLTQLSRATVFIIALVLDLLHIHVNIYQMQ